MSEKKIQFFISTPEGIAFENDIESCVLPAIDGEWAIKYNHAPIVLLLGQGTLRIKTDAWKYFHVKSGIAHIGKNKVNIICDSAIDADKLSSAELENLLKKLQDKSPENSKEREKRQFSMEEVKSKLQTLKQQASA